LRSTFAESSKFAELSINWAGFLLRIGEDGDDGSGIIRVNQACPSLVKTRSHRISSFVSFLCQYPLYKAPHPCTACAAKP